MNQKHNHGRHLDTYIMITTNLLFLLFFPYLVKGHVIKIHDDEIKENQKIDFLTELIISNLKNNGWNNIIIFGNFPDNLYLKLKIVPYTFVTSNTNEDDYYVEDAVPYYSNTILINCIDFGNFEESLLQVMSLPYWHPLANLYLYYHTKESEEKIAKIFYIFWYYRACNVVLIQYDDTDESLCIYHYTPFVSDVSQIKDNIIYGCWTTKKLGMPINTFEGAFTCEEYCHNVSINSELRATSLGTCIKVIAHAISYRDRNTIRDLKLLEDKGKNFHGFAFRAFTTEVLPFMQINENPDHSYSLASRDGTIWRTIAELLNFTIDFNSSVDVIKKPFNFEVGIKHLFAVVQRKGDLLLMPLYQFDLVVLEFDYTFAYKESGVCFVAHRADFETILFDSKTLIGNYDIAIQFGVCFCCIWLVFCLYGGTETREINMDFIGKNFMNSVRSILLINLWHPPKRISFRLFLTITIWSFFVLNFSTQAAIISFFTAHKRGREVNTFEDILEKGYRIEGMASPDVVLPDTEERFRMINSRLSPIGSLYSCVKALSNDSHRFCLVDCSVGRYIEYNMLSEKGEQYLHIAKDRVHSYYLNFIFPKYSVMTDNYNKYMMILFEAGLIKKWEEYRFNDIKEDVPTKPLGMDDVKGIFNLCGVFSMITVVVFVFELCIGNFNKIKLYMTLKN